MSTTSPGMFITFEGIDGSGKSTQMGLLAARLRAAGYPVVETIEPGGTRIGQAIRRLLLDPAHRELRPATELLLYFAARAQNVGECIRPALDRGAIVLSDRFTDSTWAYQGVARGLGEDAVLALHRIACGALNPDLTLLIDIDLQSSRERALARNARAAADRIEEQADEFHHRVRDAYAKLAARFPERVRLIDGRPGPDTVSAAIWEQVRPLLTRLG